MEGALRQSIFCEIQISFVPRSFKKSYVCVCARARVGEREKEKERENQYKVKEVNMSRGQICRSFEFYMLAALNWRDDAIHVCQAVVQSYI